MNGMKILLVAAALYTPVVFSQSCDYELQPGDEFFFPTTSADLAKYGYQFWGAEPRLNLTLSYERYAGKKGKLTSEQVPGRNRLGTFQKAILENCEIVYAEVPQGSIKGNIVTFRRDVDTASRLVGRKIWINQTGVAKSLELATENSKLSYPLAHLEEVEVIGLSLEKLGHTRGAGPFYLKLRKASGETGLLVYSIAYFYLSKPAT